MQIKETQLVEFNPGHQQAVEALVLPIQQGEFGVPITRDEQPDLVDIAGTFQKGNGNFWVALDGDKVIGSIGVVDIGNNQVALKKMFVHRDWRGAAHGVSAALMQGALDWCRQKGIKQVFLGTTGQMVAAHKFYEKHGFVARDVAEMPSAFPVVHVDTRFYRLDLV